MQRTFSYHKGFFTVDGIVKTKTKRIIKKELEEAKIKAKASADAKEKAKMERKAKEDADKDKLISKMRRKTK